MSKSTDLPDDLTRAGLDFNYAVWTAHTQITMANVPWSSDYRDVVRFTNQAALDNYLTTQAGPVKGLTKLTYAPVGRPVRVDIPFNVAYRYNYLRVANGTMPTNGDQPRVYYYFISDVEFISPETTALHIQLDVWQTFGYDAEFGNCYVERGHIGIANERQMDDNGREFLTIPEGLDLGGEYEIASIDSHFLADSNTYGVLILSTVSLENSGGTTTEPKLASAFPNYFEGLPNGASTYYCESRTAFSRLMNALSTIPWVSSGIVSITAIPKIPDADLDYDVVQVGEGVTTDVWKLKNFKLGNQKITLATNWRPAIQLGRYSRLKKFLTYPYTVVEATTYTGNPLVLKPESMYGDALEFVLASHLAAPNPRIVYWPYRYNASGNLEPWVNPDGSIAHDRAEFLDMTTGIMNLPTFALTNNGYMMFLAQNANSIAYQHSAADWAQQRAMAGNQLGFNQSTAGMQLNSEQTRLSNSAARQTTDLANRTAAAQALIGTGTGIVGGAASGPAGLGSAALGGARDIAGMAVGVHQRNEQMGIGTGLATAQTQAGNRNAAYVRDTNKEYADYAAVGDYQNTIAGINAKVQDAKMIQPTTSGQMGGDAFNLVVYRWGLDVKVKTLQGAAMNAIGEFWLRYGYMVNRFAKIPADFMVMEKFTYWKLRETYLKHTACPEVFRLTLRGIFEKGVTVWSDPSYMGNIDLADNAPKSGVTL